MDSTSADAFLCFTGNDSVVASELKEFLESQEIKGDDGNVRKLTTLTYNDVVSPGQNIVDALGNAIANCRRLVMICTIDLMKSDFCMQEYTMATYYQLKRGIVTCIPVLCKGMTVEDLPVCMRNIKCLDERDPAFREKLITAVKTDVPVSSTVEVNRTGIGLAWSYFYGYLDIILPDIRDRINAKQAEDVELKESPIYPKFITVVPLSCETPSDISELDPNFQFAFHLRKEKSVAGNKGRDYTNSVYKFTYYNEKNQKMESRHLVMEFSTPVRSLRKMFEGGLARLREKEMRLERDKFTNVVMQILDYPQMSACSGKCLVVDFKDVDTKSTAGIQKKETLTQAVLSAIEMDEILDSMKK